MDLTLDLLRAKAARAIGTWLWLHVPLVVAMTLLRGMDPVYPGLAVLLLAGLVEAASVRRPGATSGHVILAFAYGAIVAIMVGVMQGNSWQIDMHMYFFAALAIISALCSWPAILAFVGFVAVHHLSLNVLMTRYVFNGDPDLMRVILHAVILVAEGVVLGVLTFVLAQIFARSEAGIAASVAARAEAEALLAQRSEAQATQGKFLTRLIDRITAIAGEHFESDISHGVFPGEYDAVRGSLNALCERLDQTVSTVTAATYGIQQAGGDLDRASQTLSASSRDQVETLTRATLAFDTLSASLTATARLASQADQVMSENRVEVQRGTSLLSEVVAAMGLIEQSTGQIRQIVEVMDNIAFQTNLLALNAGVEAARAGDSGRGFAVVAMEVRALAQRAAESSRDIRGLIDQGQGNVALGTRQVSLTNSALQSLLSNAGTAAEIVSSIATQVKQQSQNLVAVHSDVTGLDQQARRNAGLAHRIAEAGASLQQFSQELAQGMQVLNGQGRSDKRPDAASLAIRDGHRTGAGARAA